ncbi:MAG: hypothetical protein OCD00_19430 [Colwellia sp.]
MSLALKNIDNFLTDQVGNGSCVSVKEAEKELISLLVKRDIDRGITQGREDIKNGHFEEVNSETNAKLIEELAQELLINH